MWKWDQPQAKSFEEIKEVLCSAKSLATYDPTLPTYISADASMYGLGSVLIQTQRNGL
jgi:hypothetical protein